jgi:peroxin-12
MLFQVGGQGARPTFFEMSAAQQLPASLRAALSYSLGVSRASPPDAIMLIDPLWLTSWVYSGHLFLVLINV